MGTFFAIKQTKEPVRSTLLYIKGAESSYPYRREGERFIALATAKMSFWMGMQPYTSWQEV